jgi:hypothetical protein
LENGSRDIALGQNSSVLLDPNTLTAQRSVRAAAKKGISYQLSVQYQFRDWNDPREGAFCLFNLSLRQKHQMFIDIKSAKYIL